MTAHLSRRRFLTASAAMFGGISICNAADDLATLPTFDEEMKQALRTAPLTMKFRGTTPAELTAWQQQFTAELRGLIGPHQPPARWSTEQLSTATLPDHTREEWLLKSDGVPSLPLYVLRPLGGKTDRFPIVVALHGHGDFGHDVVAGIESTPQHTEAIRTANYDYGRQLVRDGYLVVAPCLTPFGRRATPSQRPSRTDPCAVALLRLQFLGRTLLGDNLRDIRWALDYASQRDDADPDRVACVGLSLGGRMTMVAAALDPRIKAAVVSGALNVFQERTLSAGYSCGAQLIPGLLEIGDTPEIGSLIAPRPCIWEMGSRDKLIVAGWAEQAIARLERAYAASGQPERLQFHRFDGGHQWSGTTAREMLAKHLKGL